MYFFLPGPNENPNPCAIDMCAMTFVRSFNVVASAATTLVTTLVPDSI